MVFGLPGGGGDKFHLSEGGKGGNKRQNWKIFLIAAKRRQNLEIFKQKYPAISERLVITIVIFAVMTACRRSAIFIYS